MECIITALQVCFKAIVGILPNVVNSFVFRTINSFPVSLIWTSFNEKRYGFSSYSLISKIVEWFLCVLFALSTRSMILQPESTIYKFSLIFRVFVAFWKKIAQFLWYLSIIRYYIFFTIFKSYFVCEFFLLQKKR